MAASAATLVRKRAGRDSAWERGGAGIGHPLSGSQSVGERLARAFTRGGVSFAGEAAGGKQADVSSEAGKAGGKQTDTSSAAGEAGGEQADVSSAAGEAGG